MDTTQTIDTQKATMDAVLPLNVSQAGTSKSGYVQLAYTQTYAPVVGAPQCFSLETGKFYANPGLSVSFAYVGADINTLKQQMLSDLLAAGYNTTTKTFI